MTELPKPDYAPPRWLRSRHGQTMVGRLLRVRPTLEVRRVRWETADADFIDLDVVEPPGEARGTVIVLHGLEGSSARSYVRLTLMHLRALGLRGVAMNFRGCSGDTNKRARFYHAGETGDFAEVVARLALESGPSLGAIGFSLGGNVLLKYLGESGLRSTLRGAVVVSVPFDLAAGARLIGAGIPGRIYTHYFLRSLKKKLSVKAAANSGADGIHPDLLRAGRAAKDLVDYDDVVTAPLHGFPDAAAYYAASSSTEWIPRIRTPTVVLHAADDPFLPASHIPTDRLTANPSTSLMLSPYGGHLGFLEAASPDTPPDARFGLACWAERTAAYAIVNLLDGTKPIQS